MSKLACLNDVKPSNIHNHCSSMGLPQQIEAEEAKINEKLTDANLYRDDPSLITTLQTRLAEIGQAIKQAMITWETLESLR